MAPEKVTGNSYCGDKIVMKKSLNKRGGRKRGTITKKKSKL